MNIGGLAAGAAPIAPAPEQVATAKKAQAPADEGGSQATPAAAQKEASKPSDPNNVGALHLVA